jgi:hypothetical protein
MESSRVAEASPESVSGCSTPFGINGIITASVVTIYFSVSCEYFFMHIEILSLNVITLVVK